MLYTIFLYSYFCTIKITSIFFYMKMYFLIFFILFLIVVIVILRQIMLFNNNLEQLKKQKRQQQLDFIDEEYLDYLQYTEPVLKFKDLKTTFKPSGFDSFFIKADFFYNQAGTYVDFKANFAEMATDSLFFFGKEQSASFVPRKVNQLTHAHRNSKDLIVEGLYTINNPNSKFVLEIKNAPAQLDMAFTTLLS